MLRYVLLSAIALLFASCAEKPSAEPFDLASAEAEIDILRANFEDAVAGGDMAALGAIVSPQAIMIQPGAADWKTMQQIAAGAPFPQGAKIQITPFETIIAGPEWAFERGASVVYYPDPVTGDEIRLRDSYLIIFRNEGEGWKVHREVASASPPPEGWPVTRQQ